MTLLVIGATGMLGQAVVAAAAARGEDVATAARSGAGLVLDVTDHAAVHATVRSVAPDAIVNCAALVSLAACEGDPGTAYEVNARAVAFLAEAARAASARLVHVSTDGFWIGDGRSRHDEDSPVRLVNEYARTKYAGEAFARAYPGTLTVRTNVTGFRRAVGRPTFIEWVVAALEAGESMTLFDDFYTSTLDAPALAEAVLDLLGAGATGLLHVASSEVTSKQEFIEAVARATGYGDREFATASVASLDPPRPDSLGLDVTRAEAILGRSLPDLEQTVGALAAQSRSAA